MVLSRRRVAKKLVYENETDDSRAVIGPQVPNKAGDEEEARYDKMMVQFWGEFPKSISEIILGEGTFGKGLLLMEVLEVRIISTAKKTHKLKLSGTITLDSAYGISDLFRRTPKNPEVIQAKDTLTLMGPDMAALVYDCGEISLDIKDGRREVCKGYVCFNTYDTWDDMYNKALIGELIGKNAIGQVTYAIFPCAILIEMEIKLPKMEVFNFELSAKMATVTIYGRIDASITGKVTVGCITTTLFRRKHTDGVLVSSAGGDLLPLSKNLMAFPLGGTVCMDLCLKEHLLFESGNCNIIQDSVQCTPKQFGNHKCTVDSKYGLIEIKLTAYPAEMHPKTFLGFRKHTLGLMS